MRRKTRVAMIVTLALGGFAVPASAQTNGGGNSANAPGQERAQANCTHVSAARSRLIWSREVARRRSW